MGIVYHVRHNDTKQIVAICKTRNGAMRSRDRLDMAYGAIKYHFIAVNA